jgi:hypothetical protein
VRNSLFGKDKLERSEDVAAAARKTAAADLRLESKNCASLRGFNLHANTASTRFRAIGWSNSSDTYVGRPSPPNDWKTRATTTFGSC